MKLKETIYLDTSIPSAYYDEREPEKQEVTKEFWKKLKDYRVYVSRMTIEELGKTEDVTLRKKLLSLVEGIEALPVTPECEELGARYVKEKIIPKRYEADALHIAVATIHEVDICQWQLKTEPFLAIEN